MQGRMRTAVMTGLKELRMEERPIPRPMPGEVLVKIEYIGICGSDLHYYESGRIGNFIVEPPFVLGHEAAGTVVELGEGVTQLKLGDRVALEPGRTCGHCEQCKAGKYNLCAEVQFFATPPVDGVFQEYAVHPAELCFPLPENVSTLEGALIEPLAVGFHAAMQGGAHVGQSAVVAGAGCIGLVTLMALKAMGVSRVAVIDVMEKRLEKAKELGADLVINGKEQDVDQALEQFTLKRGCDLGIETAGQQITTAQLMRGAKPGATIVFVGYSASGEMTIPIGTALDKELTMKTVFRYRNIYPMAIEAVAQGRVSLQKIVTNTFTLENAQDAMLDCVTHKADIVKGIIRVGASS